MLKRIFIILLVSALAATGYGQGWKRISTNTQIPAFLGVNTGYGNILTYRDGTIWFAFNTALWQSTDQGATWNAKTPPGVNTGVIIDIDFWDKNIGVITSDGSNGVNLLYLTKDAGTTWTPIWNPTAGGNICVGCIMGGARFVRNANEIVVCYTDPNIVSVITTNQGANWTAIKPPIFNANYDSPFYICTRRNGEINIMFDVYDPGYNDGRLSYIATTTDNGATWTNTATNRGTRVGFDYDNYSFAIDSCDPKLIYVVNESCVTDDDKKSSIYVTTDKGLTWNERNSHTENTATEAGYYSGAISAAAGGVAFVQLRRVAQQVDVPADSNGVLRTTDRGVTWQGIGRPGDTVRNRYGPQAWRDSRTLAAVNKDTVYAADQFSSVWMWTQPIPVFAPDTLFLSPFVQIVCDSLIGVARVPLKSGGCTPFSAISNVSLVGVTPGDYRIIRTNLDSVIVVFTPKATGLRTGTLSVTLLNGTVYLFPLRGTGIDTGYTVKISKDSLFFRDSILTCKTLTKKVQITLSGCIKPSLSSITGTASADYTISMIGDSAAITFAPKAVGMRRADAVFRFPDGKTVSIPLGGYGLDPGPAAGFVPSPGFNLDQVLLCQQLTRGFRMHINKCMTTKVSAQVIGGGAAGDYTLDDQLPTTLTGDDSLTITFKPSAIGARNATYTVTFSDGSVLTLQLRGTGTNTGGGFKTAPPVLFDKDTILTCKSIDRPLTIQTGSCVKKAVAYQTITGLAQADYSLTLRAPELPDSLGGNTDAIFTFSPSLIGPRPATYTLVLTDSSRVVVPLKGTGKDPGAPLDVRPTLLFEFDTIAMCNSITRGVHVKANICIAPDVKVQDITGAAKQDYSIVMGAPNPLTGDDSVYIMFAPTAAGPRSALFTLTLPAGVTFTIPLQGTGFDPGYTISENTNNKKLFTGDNVERCKTLTRSFVITSNGCVVPSVKDEKITGTSSAEYQLKSAIAKTLSGSDTITITFLPGGLGQRDGEYVLTLSDGKQIKVSLEGIGIPGKYTISVLPATLFDKDTAALCSSLERKFVITTSGCLIPTITGENITGPEASEYLRTSPLPISYSAVSGDTVTITFSPTALGKRTAKYELTFSDGKKYTIDLLGRGKNAKYNVSIKPDTMFVGDSRQLCDSVDRTLFMTRTGCAILTKSLTQIQGAAAGDYRILQDLTKPPDPLGANEVMQIRFKPTGPGLRKATLVITLDDGSLYAIDLVGVGTPSQTLTLSTSLAIATDTIGGDVAVPVFIKGLTKPEPLEMNVFFDTNLVYLGTVSLAGSSLDVPNSRGVNTSKIRFTASDVDLKVASAYSHFRVFADSLPTSNVRFDNLVVTTASAPCEYFTSGATTKTTVTGPSGCGITALSDFMRYNQIERLRIYPNPTQGSITVESSHSLGTVTITVSDAVGSVRLTENTELSKAKPATLDLSKLPSGLYFVRVSGSGAAVPVVVSK